MKKPLSRKQIRYLWAVGALTSVQKGFSAKTDVRSSIGLTGTKRQYMRAVGRVGADLAVGEVSKTHQVKIGDKLYPIKKDRNLSSYPVGDDGKMFGVSGWPEGEVSIVRIAPLNAKRIEKGEAQREAKSDAVPARMPTAQDFQPSPYVNDEDIDTHYGSMVTRMMDAMGHSDLVTGKVDNPDALKPFGDPSLGVWENGYRGRVERLLASKGKTKVSLYSQEYRDAEEELDKLDAEYQQKLYAPRLENVMKRLPEMQQQFESILDQLEPMTRMTHSGLAGVLADGRFKSQVETGKTMAATKSIENRKKHDASLFGRGNVGAIYGYMGLRDGSSEDFMEEHPLIQYGEVAVTLKKQVRERTTVTIGDSLDESHYRADVIPTPLTKPQIHTQSSGSLVRAAESEIPLTPKNAAQHYKTGYIEAQIHGGLKASDIDHVTFRGSKKPAKTLLAQLESLGITYTIGSDQGVKSSYKSRGK